MPLETFAGPDVPTLLARARAALGPDAIVVALSRAEDAEGFQLVAGDPLAAAAARPTATRGSDRAPARAPRAFDPALTAMAPVAPARMRWTGRAGSARRVRDERAPLVIALVGPTGAGKTTTIAKLANHPEVFGPRRVGLLCLDTYRVGAVEQARIYAELSRAPFAVVHEARDLSAARHRLSGCDVILVDTAGRGPRALDDTRAAALQLAELAPDEVHLVLPAGLDATLLRRVLARHRGYRPTHVLATKLDELPEDTGVFELARREGLPMRWSADGQEVPHDLRSARHGVDMVRATFAGVA